MNFLTIKQFALFLKSIPQTLYYPFDFRGARCEARENEERRRTSSTVKRRVGTRNEVGGELCGQTLLNRFPFRILADQILAIIRVLKQCLNNMLHTDRLRALYENHITLPYEVSNAL